VFLNDRCESLDCYIRAVSYLAMVQPQTIGPVLIRFLDEKAIQPDAQKEMEQKEKGGKEKEEKGRVQDTPALPARPGGARKSKARGKSALM
jgi:hypothetical protein